MVGRPGLHFSVLALYVSKPPITVHLT
jgi:hypothetical protein